MLRKALDPLPLLSFAPSPAALPRARHIQASTSFQQHTQRFLESASLSTSARSSSMFPSRPRDIQQFLTDYPGQSDNLKLRANIEFYLDKRPMRPDRRTYEQFMRDTEGDYDQLEANHSYIQWLFPIREHGVNPLAQPLQPHEIRSMSETPEILDRVLRSYKMMLSFYGIEFNEGNLRRSKEYQERFANLANRSHNLLRLTRILKYLSELPPFQPHAAPLVLFFVAQHSEGHLDFTGGVRGRMAGDSLDQWWSGVFRDQAEREEVAGIIRSRGEFGGKTWGDTEYARWYEVRVAEGKVGYQGQ